MLQRHHVLSKMSQLKCTGTSRKRLANRTRQQEETHQNASYSCSQTSKAASRLAAGGGKGRYPPTRCSAAFAQEACPRVIAGSGKTRRLMRLSLVSVLVTASKPRSGGSKDQLESLSPSRPIESPADESWLPCVPSEGPADAAVAAV